jgi:hypothetical protein
LLGCLWLPPLLHWAPATFAALRAMTDSLGLAPYDYQDVCQTQEFFRHGDPNFAQKTMDAGTSSLEVFYNWSSTIQVLG